MAFELLVSELLRKVGQVPRVAWEAGAGGFAPTFTSLAMGMLPQWRRALHDDDDDDDDTNDANDDDDCDGDLS